MALPKRRHSYSRTRKRRAHDALTLPGINVCSECGEAKLPHHLCSICGTYKKRAVIHLEDELA